MGSMETPVSSNGRNSAEVALAINPVDSDHAVIAAMGGGSSGTDIFVAFTVDGGITWQSTAVPKANDASFQADPMLAIGLDGQVHLVSIPVVSGSPLGIELHRSSDGGVTWSLAQRISSNVGQDDKTAIAVDTNPSSPFFGRTYVVWKWVSGGVYLSHSDDQGQSWTSPRRIGAWSAAGLDIAVSAAGTVFVSMNVGVQSIGILLIESEDGGQTFRSNGVVGNTRAGYEIWPRAACGFSGVHVQTSLSVLDPVDSAQPYIWVSWNDYKEGFDNSCNRSCSGLNSCRTGAYYVSSLDGGDTFSDAQRIPGLGDSSGDQFFSWLSVNQQTGNLYAIFKDSATDESRVSAHTVVVSSEDLGLTWGEPMAVTSTAAGTINWQGDYMMIRASEGRVIGAWPDYRNGPGEVYATVLDDPDASTMLGIGHAGSWYNPETPGQGFAIDVVVGDDRQPESLIAYFFTFDDLQGSSKFAGAGQRWFVASGPINGSSASLTVALVTGGVFDDPAATQTNIIGTMSFDAESCTRATMTYSFNEDPPLADGQQGIINLVRLTPSTRCEQ